MDQHIFSQIFSVYVTYPEAIIVDKSRGVNGKGLDMHLSIFGREFGYLKA
jgi:hypothetical protein